VNKLSEWFSDTGSTAKEGGTGRIVSLIFSDTHPNSTVAICPPEVSRDDGDKHIISSWQMWLWQSWLDLIEKAKTAAMGGAKLYVFGNGDLVEFDAKDRSNQLISTNKSTALDIAEDVYSPAVSAADRFIVIRGTGAHTGKSSEYEEILAKNLGAEKDAYGRHAQWYFLAPVGGVLFEIAHHTAGGKRPSTATGSVARLAEETILEYGGTKDRIPDLVVRGHVHRYHDSFDNIKGCRAITLPCWTGATDHVHRIGAGTTLPDIGGTIVVSENGHFDVKTYTYKPVRKWTWTEG